MATKNQITIQFTANTKTLRSSVEQIKRIVVESIQAAREVDECMTVLNKVLNQKPEQLRQLRKQVELAYTSTSNKAHQADETSLASSEK